MKKTALIMAGGHGERFWPRSRKTLPKQFLSLTNSPKTMIQLTVERILPLVDMEDIYISTNKDYKDLILNQLPELPAENIICEPVGKNTAPCIGLGAIHVNSKYEDALMIVLPSDHLIKHDDIFIETLQNACDVAEADNNLVTIGITPNCPETGYGYINFNPNETIKSSFAVSKFVEKPSFTIAKQYLESGEYLWNSGMFVWKVSTILKSIHNYLPETYNGLVNIKAALRTSTYDNVLLKEFIQFSADSIDYGIMEKSSNIYVVPGNFGWDDVGSWLAVERIKPIDSDDNIITGNVTSYNTQNCIIEADNKLIATVGIKDLIIVDTEDATLICSKTSSGNIKELLKLLREEKKDKYL